MTSFRIQMDETIEAVGCDEALAILAKGLIDGIIAVETGIGSLDVRLNDIGPGDGPVLRIQPEVPLIGEVALPRRFVLERDVDITGHSGTGLVAWGVQYPDGRVSARWNGEIAQTSSWDSIADMISVHGHDGMTHLAWLDE